MKAYQILQVLRDLSAIGYSVERFTGGDVVLRQERGACAVIAFDEGRGLAVALKVFQARGF